ncbi:MAG TPA: hypothetical protein DCR93_07925, partial [Cytophagales bacterium]|nr:hypothetical protein [Cytophagales bacterium]
MPLRSDHTYGILSSLLCGLLLFSTLATAQPRYARADSMAHALKGAPLHDLYGLAQQLTLGLTMEEEKFRAIYTWTVQNLKNDTQLYTRTMNARKRLAHQPERLQAWNRRMQPKVWDQLLHKKKTLCTGYAYFLSYLAEQVDITCVPVAGYSRTSKNNVGGAGLVNHHWNAVHLNGVWYLCDPTWSSGLYRLWGKDDFQDPYFLMDPHHFVLTHYPVDTAWLLVEDPRSLQSFLDAPLVYPAGQREGLMPLRPQGFWVR